MLPIAPSPTLLYAAYPSETADPSQGRYTACDLTDRPGLAEVLALRNYNALNRIFASPESIAAVLTHITATGPQGATVAEITTATALKPMFIDRVLMWLLKYDFIHR